MHYGNPYKPPYGYYWKTIPSDTPLAVGSILEQHMEIKLADWLAGWTPDSIIDYIMENIVEKIVKFKEYINDQIDGRIELIYVDIKPVISGREYDLVVQYQVTEVSPLPPIAIALAIIKVLPWIALAVIGLFIYLSIKEVMIVARKTPEVAWIIPASIAGVALLFYAIFRR